MIRKRSQLFIMYSLSIIGLITLFSFAIHFIVSYSEEERMQTQMIEEMSKVQDNLGDVIALQNYANESNVNYFIWSGLGTLDNIEPILTNVPHLLPTKPTIKNMRKLERTIVERQFTWSNAKDKSIYFSYSEMYFSADGKIIVIQIVRSIDETVSIMNNLNYVLLFGGGIVSIVGIILGIMLAYLNMLPVIKAWMQQRTFVADASHELRTPLSVITLKSDRLLTASDDTIYDHIEDVAVIQQECRRMHKMVDELLFLAKSDSGVIQVAMENFSVQTLLHEIEMLYTEFFELEDKQLIITCDYAGEVYADIAKIKQVIMIVIDNALRFTTAGNYVKCVVEVKSNRVNFTISNNGIPLDSKEIPLIFNRFYKSDASRTRDDKSDGNGLGLSIAQEIIHAHQGKIRAYVQNDITHFVFSLQKAKERKK